MSKVTSKLQVTIPKQVADQYGIRPGDDIEWLAAGETLRVVPQRRPASAVSPQDRVTLFDAATERQRRRQEHGPATGADGGRGWTREELYTRGRTA